MADQVQGVGGRVRALRACLGLSQEQLAKAGGLERTEIVSVETGRNLATSHRIRKGLARGFGLDQETVDAYLDGEIPRMDMEKRLAEQRRAEAS